MACPANSYKLIEAGQDELIHEQFKKVKEKNIIMRIYNYNIIKREEYPREIGVIYLLTV